MGEKLNDEAAGNPEHVLWSQEISALLRQQGFDEQTCQELADEPFEQAFQDAYGLLTQLGQDADELMSPWTEQLSESDTE